ARARPDGARARAARRARRPLAPLRDPPRAEGRGPRGLPGHGPRRLALDGRVGPARAPPSMTIRAPAKGLADGERVLPAEESRYLSRVLRLEAGDRFVAFDPDARTEADGVVVGPSPAGLRVKIERTRPAEVTAKTRLALVYALAKGDKVDAVVRDA